MYKHNRTAKQKAYESSVQSAISGNVHPILAYMKITRKCNLACDYCVERNMLINDDMGFEEWKQASDVAYMLGNRSISLVGGEPLLSPCLLDLVEYISARDTYVSILTNGLCLNEELLHALDEAGLDNLNFSIDILNNEGQPRFGKPLTPKLERILKTIAVSNFRFRSSVAAVVTKFNLPILPKMLRYFSQLGIPIGFSLMVRGVINHTYTENLQLGEDDLDDVKQMFEQLFSMKSDGYLLVNDGVNRLRVKMGVRTPAGIYQMHRGDDHPHSCKGGVYDLPIDNDGRLGTCCTGITSSTHIFDLHSLQDYHAYIDRNKTVTDECKGCPWPHKWVLTHLAETGGFMKL